MDAHSQDQMLIAGDHICRGFAFVDLGSQAAVARAVNSAHKEELLLHGKKLVVEPSKKPVRVSGLRASNKRRAAGRSVKKSTHKRWG